MMTEAARMMVPQYSIESTFPFSRRRGFTAGWGAAC